MESEQTTMEATKKNGPGSGRTPDAGVEAVVADRLLAVAAGREVPSEVHEQVLRERPVLEVDRFNLWYGAKQALHNITMPIPHNHVTALVGPSGCGKSTLLRSVNRLNDLVPSARITGTMRLNGDSIYDPRVDVIERAWCFSVRIPFR